MSQPVAKLLRVVWRFLFYGGFAVIGAVAGKRHSVRYGKKNEIKI